jgi:hypothetical protein
MTFAASLAKASGKKPVWLYRFTVGSTVFHVTRRPSTLFGGPGHVTAIGQPDATFLASQNWTPMPLEHGKLTQSSETARSEWDMMIPAQSALGIAIRDFTDISRITVKAWQTFSDDIDEEYVVRFDGRVARRKPGLITMSLVCETGISELKFQAHPSIIQRPCRHCHYFSPSEPDEAGCRLDPDDFKVSMGAGPGSTSREVLVPDAGLSPDGHYTYGLMFHDGEEYFIESHVGTLITIDRPATIIPFVTTVELAPGCDGSMTVCHGTFDNSLNHGGFPHITETPWTGWTVT